MNKNIETPKSLKALLLATVGVSLLAALMDGLFPSSSLQRLLSLSAAGIQNLYLWQLFSYLFVQPETQGISFSFLFKIAFNAFILWFVGNSLIQKRGLYHFFALYFLGGLIGSLVAFGLLSATASPLFFAGNLSALYALLIGWITAFPRINILLFFAVPVSAKNVVYVFLVLTFIIDLSTGNWIYALSYAAAAAVGFCYGHLFPEAGKEKVAYTRAKIFDFKTGRAILNDDAFLEEMLSKISLHGKKSLTWREKWRLRAIAKRRKK